MRTRRRSISLVRRLGAAASWVLRWPVMVVAVLALGLIVPSRWWHVSVIVLAPAQREQGVEVSYGSLRLGTASTHVTSTEPMLAALKGTPGVHTSRIGPLRFLLIRSGPYLRSRNAGDRGFGDFRLLPRWDDLPWTGFRTSYMSLWLPLWLVVAALGPPSLLAWRSRRRRLSRAGRDLCRACGYDLAGLAPGAACPECGEGGEVLASAASSS